MSESKLRSVAKSITWRITGSSSTALISYLMTGNLIAAGSIAGTQFVVNIVLYYVHERVWLKVPSKNK